MLLSLSWICLLLSSVSHFPDTHPCLVIPCLLLFPVSIWLVFIIFMLFMSIPCWYLSSLSTCSTCSFDGQRTLASPLFCSPCTPWALPLLCHICIFSVILGLPAGAHVSRAVTLAPTLPARSYPLGWRKTRDFSRLSLQLLLPFPHEGNVLGTLWWCPVLCCRSKSTMSYGFL